MIAIRKNPNNTFLKNIEEAIKEQGTLACPNFDCKSKLISKKIMSEEGDPFLEYHCQNSTCSFHKKRKIAIELEPIAKHNFKLNSDYYLLALGIFLLSVFCYTGYNLFQINSFIEAEIEEIQQPKSSTHKNADLQKQKIITTQND